MKYTVYSTVLKINEYHKLRISVLLIYAYLKAKMNTRLKQKNANRLPIMDEFSRKSRLIKLLCMVAFLKMHDRTIQMEKKIKNTRTNYIDVSRCFTKIHFECEFVFKNIHVFVIFPSSKQLFTRV